MIVTFYSFKGGVGRSMAMANVGEILADVGYHVVVCDWDLEAPGLERYFATNHALEAQYRQEMDDYVAWPGLVELLQEYKETLARPGSADAPSDLWADSGDYALVGNLRIRRPSSYARPVSTNLTKPGSIRLLPAGTRAGESAGRYAESVRRFDWQEFYERWAGDAYIDFFRRDLVGDREAGLEGATDILLVDSRTGVTEQGGVCTHHLADVVVLVTAANDLNLEGSRWMARALAAPQLVKLRAGRPLQVLPVASRIEQTAQHDELLDFRRRFLAEFRSLIDGTVGEADDFALRSEIPYMPFYSFHERVVAREPEDAREQKLYGAYRALAEGLVRCGVRSGLLREPTSQGVVARGATARPPSAGLDLERLRADFVAAADEGDGDRLEELVASLENEAPSSDAALPAPPAIAILRLLRGRGLTDLAQRVAETLLTHGMTDPKVRLLYAQALLDAGKLSAAQTTLLLVVTETKSEPRLQAEARGLVGRVFKQLFCDVPDSTSTRAIRYLERAVNEYLEVYRADLEHNVSQGINVAALVARARRDGIRLESAPDPFLLAHEILNQVHQRMLLVDPAPDFADQSAAFEACLVRGSVPGALDWLGFMIRSADLHELREVDWQLRRVWQLRRDSALGTSVLPVLELAILRAGGQIVPARSDLWQSAPPPLEAEKQLTKLLHSTGLRSLEWYETGLVRSRSVGRIETSDGSPIGTGFLLAGKTLHPSLGAELFLVTAAHVLFPSPSKGQQLTPNARVTFEALTGKTTRSITGTVFVSQQLDVAVARLERPVEAADAYRTAASVPVGAALYLIGHPGGRGLSIAATDSLKVEFDLPWIRYRASAEPGSAGSPVFDGEWRLVAVHRARHLPRLSEASTRGLCEGIWIGSVRNAVANHLRKQQRSDAPKRARSKPAKSSRRQTSKRK